MITIEQIRAARALLGWNQYDLAQNADLSQTGIARIENGTNNPNTKTLSKILHAFESENIQFIGSSGVQKTSGEVKKYNGQDGFLRFYDDLYRTLANTHSAVRISNADERDFEKWLGPDNLKKHVETILELKAEYKILIREGDTHFITSEFSEYRWMPQEQFGSVPFYLYGNKIAFIIFKDEPQVLVLDYPDIADAYKKQFDSAWDNAEKPR